jgi:hypothetical protein
MLVAERGAERWMDEMRGLGQVAFGPVVNRGCVKLGWRVTLLIKACEEVGFRSFHILFSFSLI